jgi:hypothetical protein
VFNIAGALPFAIAPAIAPAVLAIGGDNFGVLYAVAGACAVLAARRGGPREGALLSIGAASVRGA